MKPLLIGLVLLGVWNLITFFMMGLDKHKARKQKRRISEKTLLLSAFFMGAVGAGAGMMVFRHKTLKWKFRILVPLALLCNGAVLFGIGYLILGLSH